MRHVKTIGLVPSVTYNVYTRRLLTNSNKRPDSSPSKSQSRQPSSGRFLPAKPGTRVAVPARQPPQAPAPTRQDQREEEWQAVLVAEPLFRTAEELHIRDVEALPFGGNHFRFVFPRGACPKLPWWDRQKPAGTGPSGLRWTSGKMYPHFWIRSRGALEASITGSALLGAAGVWAVVSHTDGPADTSTCLSVFAALALPAFAYGIYRSRILQEAWMGLVGCRRGRRGESMMPYIHPDAKWSYMWWLCPMKRKAGDYVAFR